MLMDTLWVFLAAILVFFMNLGFAAVESGFARSKNTVTFFQKISLFRRVLVRFSAAGVGTDVRRQ